MISHAQCLMICLALIGATAHARVLIDTDFSVLDKPVEKVDPERDRHITGLVPQDWRDDMGWMDGVTIEYRPMEEDGRHFLRIIQTAGATGQFARDLREVEDAAGYYRLRVVSRSPTGAGAGVGIRFIGAPYSTVWSSRLPSAAEWQETRFQFRLDRQPQDVGLWVWMYDDGILDLDHVRLEKLTEEELAEAIRAEHPGPPAPNLVRNSRFPLGLESGWCLSRDYCDAEEVAVSADPEVIGPSGYPALRLESLRKGIMVSTAPFPVPWSFERHTASVYLRGDTEGRLRIMADGRQRAEQAFGLQGDDFRRVSITFQPELLGRAHQLQIEADDSVWLDALQVVRGTELTPYASQMTCEVALGLPASEAARARVQFMDEPAEVEFCVTGEAPGAVLRSRVVNAYGDEQALPDVPLGEGDMTRARARYDVFPARPYGAHRVEAWVEDAAGERISPYSELVVYRLRRPRHWGQDAPDSFFGVHTNPAARHLVMAKAVGCNWVRLHDSGTRYIGWAHLEPVEKGEWVFYDEEIHRYRRYDLKILGLLSTAPGWATHWGEPTTGYFERYMQPKSMDDWADYVRVVTQRYRGVIDAWDVWNEPWGTSFWSLTFDHEATDRPWRSRFLRGETAEADFALLQKAALEAAREVDPSLNILGVDTIAGDRGRRWTEAMLEHGAVETCDVICYHHYTHGTLGFPGDPAEAGWEDAIAPIRDHFGEVPRPVWMTEGAPLGRYGSGFYHHTLTYEDEQDVVHDADRMARYLVAHRALGDAKVFLYTMHGHGLFGPEHPWTSLVGADGYLHPTAAAHSFCAWLLEDAEFAGRGDVAELVHAYVFSAREGAVAVVCPRPGHDPWALPQEEGLGAWDVFGNPVEPGAEVRDHSLYLVGERWTAEDLRALLGLEGGD